ncbi:MAG: hypothetical protein KKD73_01775 [Proteobacteria bacterium]|nr:hypothetical protein [Pseudomonadota bacterium]
MTDIQIIGAIMLATGLRGPAFAKENNITKSTLYRVAAGDLETDHVRELISKTLKRPIIEI